MVPIEQQWSGTGTVCPGFIENGFFRLLCVYNTAQIGQMCSDSAAEHVWTGWGWGEDILLPLARAQDCLHNHASNTAGRRKKGKTLSFREVTWKSLRPFCPLFPEWTRPQSHTSKVGALIELGHFNAGKKRIQESKKSKQQSATVGWITKALLG